MHNEKAIEIHVQIASPFVTVRKFAEITGIPERSVRNMRSEGKLPVMDKNEKNGRVLINMVAFTAEAARQAQEQEKVI